MPKSGEKGPVLIPQILVPAPTPAQYLTKHVGHPPHSNPVWSEWRGRRPLMLARSKRKATTLRSICLDTPDPLQMRRDGRRWIQTVNSEIALYGGIEGG